MFHISKNKKKDKYEKLKTNTTILTICIWTDRPEQTV